MSMQANVCSLPHTSRTQYLTPQGNDQAEDVWCGRVIRVQDVCVSRGGIYPHRGYPTCTRCHHRWVGERALEWRGVSAPARTPLPSECMLRGREAGRSTHEWPARVSGRSQGSVGKWSAALWEAGRYLVHSMDAKTTLGTTRLHAPARRVLGTPRRTPPALPLWSLYES